MELQYCEIRITVFDEDLLFAVNKVFNRLHGILRSRKLNVGLSFPDMTSHTPGGRIRIFGAFDHLSEVARNSGLADLARRRMVEMGPINPIPATASAVAYIRARPTQVVSRAAIQRRGRRMRRRMEARGEQWTDKIADSLYQQLRKKADESENEPLPFLLLERDDRKLPIYIRRQFFVTREPRETPQFNSYGLGNGNDGSLSAVYDF